MTEQLQPFESGPAIHFAKVLTQALADQASVTISTGPDSWYGGRLVHVGDGVVAIETNQDHRMHLRIEDVRVVREYLR